MSTGVLSANCSFFRDNSQAGHIASARPTIMNAYALNIEANRFGAQEVYCIGP